MVLAVNSENIDWKRMQKLIRYFSSNPKKLFLADAAGALLTALVLMMVLRNWNSAIGLSKSILTWLAMIALALSIYSTSCFLFLRHNWKPFIRVICYGNLLYCVFTAAALLYNSHTVTVLGVLYFSLEIAVIGTLIYVEHKLASFPSDLPGSC